MSVTTGGTITGTGTLHVTDCPTCGCIYAIPDGIRRTGLDQKAGRAIYCPNGHSWHYTGKTHEREVRDLQDSLAAARARRDQAEAEARTARMREVKERKAKQRLQKRAAAGVCPHCNRTFQQLARHMQSKHHDEGGGNE